MGYTDPVPSRVQRNERMAQAMSDDTYVGKKYREKAASSQQAAEEEIPDKFEIQVKRQGKGGWKTIKVHDNEKAAAAHYRRTQTGPGISKRIKANGKVVHTEEGK